MTADVRTTEEIADVRMTSGFRHTSALFAWHPGDLPIHRIGSKALTGRREAGESVLELLVVTDVIIYK